MTDSEMSLETVQNQEKRKTLKLREIHTSTPSAFVRELIGTLVVYAYTKVAIADLRTVCIIHGKSRAQPNKKGKNARADICKNSLAYRKVT